MKNNLITLETQENEINKILQEGIDKSLLYLNSFKQSDLNNFSKSAKNLTNKTRTKKTSKTEYSTKNKIIIKNPTLNENTLKRKKIEFNPFSLSQINIKQKSLNKTMKPKKKMSEFDYQVEYNKKREELEKCKNDLIQERIKQNKLQKEMSIKLKKEKEFNKLEENDNIIEKKSEDLIFKIQQSERIREEQTKIIERLLSEYNFMINKLRRNPNIEIVNKYDELKLEADSLKKEGMAITKKKKNSKKIIKSKSP